MPTPFLSPYERALLDEVHAGSLWSPFTGMGARGADGSPGRSVGLAGRRGTRLAGSSASFVGGGSLAAASFARNGECDE